MPVVEREPASACWQEELTQSSDFLPKESLTQRTRRNANSFLMEVQVYARHATRHCLKDTKVIAVEEAVAILV